MHQPKTNSVADLVALDLFYCEAKRFTTESGTVENPLIFPLINLFWEKLINT